MSGPGVPAKPPRPESEGIAEQIIDKRAASRMETAVQRRKDPAVVSLADVLAALEQLDTPARRRVLSSAAAFYGIGWEVLGGEGEG